MQRKSVVVTGVSSGLGQATTRKLIADGWHVFGSVRKPADAQGLEDEFPDTFSPLVFDVTDPDAIEAAAGQVSGVLQGQTLGGLVNNAGVAVSGPLRHIPIDELRFQFEVNVFGMIQVSQAFAPLLGADGTRTGPPGKIINLSSVHGKLAMPIFGPYSMSKHAVESLSGSLRRELLMHGIDVVIVAPGAVRTPIWEKADDVDVEQYRDTEYYQSFLAIKNAARGISEAGLEPKIVADTIASILKVSKPKTRYSLVANKMTNWHLPRLLPARLVDKLMTKRIGISKKPEVSA